MKLNIIILAAGVGKRMHSALPKVLHQIGGVPMLERVVNTAKRLNPDQVYVVHGNGGDIVKTKLEHLNVTWVEQKQQLGTGHAILQVMPQVTDGRILVLYGDVPLISPELLIKLLKTPETELGLLTAKVEDPFGYGRIVRINNKIVDIVEQKEATIAQQSITEINTGILVASTELLKNYLGKLKNTNAQNEYYLTDVIAMAATDNYLVHGILAPNIEEVFGVNDKHQLAHLERYYQRQIAVKFMQQGLTLMDPNRFDLRGELEFGTDVTIDVNVVIKGKVKLGNNVQILPNCVIEDAEIADNCSIGPFARIRPGTKIKANAKIGNFVEMKKTEFGENSKAGHLSYLGNAIIGKNVNIGAGTITCNYDGVNKAQTIIEDGAFIGSNSSLVAPVTIEENAYIGSGSNITENALANKLTIARSRQTTIKNWKKPRKK